MAEAECLLCSMEETSPLLPRVSGSPLGRGGGSRLRGARVVLPPRPSPRREADRSGRHGGGHLRPARPGPRQRGSSRPPAPPAVYLLSFGENYRHFHALVAARGEEIPPAQRGGALLGLLTEGRDPLAAQALVPAVRAAYEQIVRGREPAQFAT